MKVQSLSTGEITESKPPRAGIDKTPSLIQQSQANGWTAGEFSFGKADDGAHHFNPSIVERADGIWLIVRRAVFSNPQDRFGINSCWAFKLESLETLKPEVGYRLKFPEGSSGLEQFEDPRAVFQNNQTFVGAVNFIWYGNGEWTGARQVLGLFDDQWNCTQLFRPNFGGNSVNVEEKSTKHQKNWVWWFHNHQLHLLYHSKPWRVAAIGKTFDESIPYESEGISINYGEIRGGTPPVLVDNLYWTFFHSSVPWVDRFRRYHMGAVAFESSPPFKPVLITPAPLLTGSQNDYWLPRKPLVIFPGGTLFKNGEWLIVAGVNDLKCAWFKIPHTDILRRAKPIGEVSPAELICEPKQTSASVKVTRLSHKQETVSSTLTPATNLAERREAFATRKGRTSNGEHSEQATSCESREASMVSGATACEYQSLGDQIRQHVQALKEIEAGIPSRRARMLEIMRREKLIPQARHR